MRYSHGAGAPPSSLSDSESRSDVWNEETKARERGDSKRGTHDGVTSSVSDKGKR